MLTAFRLFGVPEDNLVLNISRAGAKVMVPVSPVPITVKVNDVGLIKYPSVSKAWALTGVAFPHAKLVSLVDPARRIGAVHTLRRTPDDEFGPVGGGTGLPASAIVNPATTDTNTTNAITIPNFFIM
jgi:hypothetical protein